MGFLTFLHPGALWLATGAALPLIIHLFSRQKPRVILFPAVRFIRSSRRRSVRRTRLKHLLLLLLRMGLIALFASLIARPIFGAGAGVAGQDLLGTPAAVLILDDSLSMGYTVGDTSWFDAARNRALQLLGEMPRHGALAVLTSSRPTGSLTREASDVAHRLQGLRPTMRANSCWRALENAAELLKPGEAGRRDVFLFTDMTRGAWLGYERRNVDMGPNVNLFVVDCAGTDPLNGAVTELRDEGQPALAGSLLGLRTRVLASGGPIARTVEFEFDGKALDRQDVSLDDGEETWLRFTVRLTRSGHHWGRVKFLNPDSLAPDDSYVFAVDVQPDVAVLCVEDDPNQEADSPSYFFRLALNPWGEEGRSVFTVRRVSAEGLDDESLGWADVVVLTGTARMEPENWRRLGAYVSGGGGLLVFCGPETEDAYRVDDAVGTLGARIDEVVVAPAGSPFGLRTVQMDHPFVKALESSGARLGEVRFTRCRRIVSSGSAEEVMSFGAGMPGLLMDDRGGRTALFAGSVDERWGLFARTPVFVPFCEETLLYLAARSGAGARSYGVGAHVPIEYDSALWPTVVQVTAPGSMAPERLLPGTTPGRVTYWKTDVPGYYKVDFDHQDSRWQGGFAVNPVPVESYLERAGFDDVKGSLHAASVELMTEATFELDSSPGGPGSRELTPSVALLALCFLVAECFLANRFYGRQDPANEVPAA